MNYYDVHCTECGKVFSAADMKANLDPLIQIHLDKLARKSSDSFYLQAKELFEEIKIGIIFTKVELINNRYMGCENDNLKLMVRDVIRFMERKYEVKIPEKFPERQMSKEELGDNDFWVEFGRPEEIPKRDESGMAGGEVIDINALVDKLNFKLQFYNQSDIDESEKRRMIENLLQLFLENKDKVLLECVCEFKVQEDDQHREYLSGLEVTFVDGMHKYYDSMACPYCGEKLFPSAGKYEEKVIVMLGSSRVGKTAYLAAFVNQHTGLNDGYADILSMGSVAGSRYESFRREILLPYRAGKKILKTDVNKEKAALFPMQITMNQKTVNYIFVDLPGEVFVPNSEQEKALGAASGDFIANHKRICGSADAFWFCIDPIQIDGRLSGVNDRLQAEDRVETDLGMVLANITNIISMIGTAKSKIPTAIVLTKSDLIEREAGLYSSIQDVGINCTRNNDQFKVDEAREVSEKVKEYLQSSYMTMNLISLLDRIFDCKSYFSVAAYGKTVSEQEQGGNMAPYGIDLPFLWTAACFGYLKPVQFVQKVKNKGFFGKTQDIFQYWEEVEVHELFV